ncbi:hypothetical protein [Sagittula sp. S175]|uniref:hypothetical protein n=1 Tax=Sagittula sp. S175 TaxID=3415129 RepID=UPI003C7AB872
MKTLLAALLAVPLALPAVAQTTVTNNETGETIVIDGPPPEAPLAISLFKHLNRASPDGKYATRFEHTGDCLYRMVLQQDLDGGAKRETITDFSVRDLTMDGYEERTYSPSIAELVLPFAEGTGQTATITLTGADDATLANYRESLEMTCEGDVCSGAYPTPTLHLTILSDTAESDMGFANMAMGALMNACRPKE